MMSLAILSGTLVITLAAAVAVLRTVHGRASSSAQPYRGSREHRPQPHFERRIQDWRKAR